MASSFITNALQVNFDSILGIQNNEGMKYVAIYETRFAGFFNLLTDGLTNLSEVPKDLVLQESFLLSKSGEPVQVSCKKRLMKYEFLLLNDILGKSIIVKAGSFDAHLAQIPDGMMLPSLTAAQPTKIKFRNEIQIRGIEDRDWYKANLPKIAATDKGNKPLDHHGDDLILSFFQSEKSEGYAVRQGHIFQRREDISLGGDGFSEESS
ncbi:hypothetical protein F511_36701 [Dorcoceras hygrometricum]|uniref:Uncharacterized protein n=1 Tax=Dorcoceras hygrometricum TaxID=472368 RepID=A0A2Z7B9S1_9LAMI|nr:hypothetical protein F511_36701 [Dorcoceras hygrometricum]